MNQPLSTRTIANRKIFFGHQSIGGNILQGLATLAKQSAEAPLTIIEYVSEPPQATAALVHSKIGKNADPLSKLQDFSAKCNELKEANLDYAMMKFCYIDFHAQTELADIERVYSETFAALTKQLPNTRFIHCTVPITLNKLGARSWLKKLLGQPVAVEQDNIARNHFNDFIRNRYAKEPIFDLAALEATDLQQHPVTFRYHGNAYQSLYSGYTQDGRHLNERGQEWIARNFIELINNLESSRQAGKSN